MISELLIIAYKSVQNCKRMQSKTVPSESPFPIKSVEGWILIITNLNEQIQEDDLFDAFSKFGEIKGLHLNLDRKTGYVKGYALIEFGNFDEANEAIKDMNGQQILDKKINVDWVFQEKPLTEKKKGK